MISFEGVKLLDEEQCFVMPQCDTYFLTEGMRRAGIDFTAYSCGCIKAGEAPIGYEDAFKRSAVLFHALEGNPACTTDYPCAIVSRVAQEDMLQRAVSLFVDADDPDVLAHREHIEQRGQRIPAAASYASIEQTAHCMNEAYYQLSYLIEDWAEQAELGEERLFTALLDPNLYSDEASVVGRGPVVDDLTSALSIFDTSQCCVQVRAGERESEGEPATIEWLDAWPDLFVTTSRRAEDMDLETLRGYDEYQNGSLLHRVFLERSIEPGHNHPMRFEALSERDGELIVLPVVGDDREVSALVSERGTGLIVVDPQTHQIVPSEFSALQESLGGDGFGVVSLDIPEVRALFAKWFPETEAVIADLRRIQDGLMERKAQEAVAAIKDAMRNGSALDLAGEDFYLPMYFGLYFPKRPEGQNVIAYDAPEAEQYLATLRESGWEGQTWSEVPSGYEGGSRVDVEGDPEVMALDVLLRESMRGESDADA